VRQWRESSCDCSEDGVALRAALPDVPGENALLRRLARRCGFRIRRKQC
jgi:hypothetical protein